MWQDPSKNPFPGMLGLRGATHFAQKAERTPPLWYRDSVTLRHLLQGAWDDVSVDLVKQLLDAFKKNDPKTIEKLLTQIKDLGSDFTEALGKTPTAVYSNLLVKAEAFWKLHAEDAGVDKPKTVLESYRERMAKNWGKQIGRFTEKYPERILEPEITKQLQYLVETKTPSVIQIDDIVDKLERTLKGEEYFKGLSDVQIARAWHADGVRNADKNGIGTVQIVGPVDMKTCPVCLNLVGVKIDVGQMLEKIDEDLNIEDVDAYVEAWSFPRLDDIEGVNRAELSDLFAANGWGVPLHPHCRHSYGWLYLKGRGEEEESLGGKEEQAQDQEQEAA